MDIVAIITHYFGGAHSCSSAAEDCLVDGGLRVCEIDFNELVLAKDGVTPQIVQVVHIFLRSAAQCVWGLF